MNENDFENMVDNILIYYPLFYRRIKTSMKYKGTSKYAKPTGYYQILGTLINEGSLPISKVGKVLYISKPNMTTLIDKLVTDKMVKRVRSKEDRRIINIEITEEGKKFLFDGRKAVEKNIEENLSSLDEKDIKTLNQSLENIKKLVLKINPQ